MIIPIDIGWLKVKTRFLLLVIAFCLMFLLNVGFSYAGDDDTNTKEVGVEWVNNYHGQPGWGDLTMCDDDAGGFRSTLVAQGFTGSWNFGDDNAWEMDFERQDLGGRDQTRADDVDFVYFAGHGQSDSFRFGVNHDGNGVDTLQLRFSEAQWGDRDLEWVTLSACSVLNFATITNWRPVFDTYLHGICGFHTAMADTDDLGRLFAEYLTNVRGPYQIREAWTRATQADPHQASSVYAACYRRINLNSYGDPIYDFGNDWASGYMGNEHWSSWDFAYTRWSC